MPSISAHSWLSFYFIVFYFIWGVFIPFWGTWLSAQGVSSENIGLLFSLGLILRFLSNLSILPRISKASSILSLVRVLGFFTLLIFSSLFILRDHFWLAVLTLFANFTMALLIPLGDIVGTLLVKQINLDYGRVRLWGSLSFILGSTAIGWLVIDYSKEAILYLIVIATFLLWSMSLLNLSPQLDEDSSIQTKEKQSPWLLLTQPKILLFILIVGLIQGSHGAFYAFGTIYWQSIGISGLNIAYLWGIAVLAEVILMRCNVKLFANWSVKKMLLLALSAAVIRWTVLGISENIYIIGFFQSFHAFTFAVTHLAVIRFIALQEKSQMIAIFSLYSGVALGLITAIFTYISGVFYVQAGSYIFVYMGILLIPVFGFLKVWRTDE